MYISLMYLVVQAIVAMDMDLTETFKLFDKDGDGTVDLKEAKQAERFVGFIVSSLCCKRPSNDNDL